MYRAPDRTSPHMFIVNAKQKFAAVVMGACHAHAERLKVDEFDFKRNHEL